MNALDYLKIAPYLNNCPKCSYGNVGTDNVTGEWHGSLEVDDNLFTRKCKCGFKVVVDVSKGTSKKSIQKQIDNALSINRS